MREMKVTTIAKCEPGTVIWRAQVEVRIPLRVCPTGRRSSVGVAQGRQEREKMTGAWLGWAGRAGGGWRRVEGLPRALWARGGHWICKQTAPPEAAREGSVPVGREARGIT